jgi:hypothetical protein
MNERSRPNMAGKSQLHFRAAGPAPPFTSVHRRDLTKPANADLANRICRTPVRHQTKVNAIEEGKMGNSVVGHAVYVASFSGATPEKKIETMFSASCA